MNVFVKGALLTVAVAVSGATSAAAQNSDNDQIDVTATVETAMTVTGAQDLVFGAVIPGFAKTVATTDAASGDFLIAGANGRGVDFTLAVPASLADASSNTLPVSFAASVGGTRATATPVADITAGGSGTLHATSGQLHVYLGGTVTPAAGQLAGSYTGVVTLTATYNGV